MITIKINELYGETAKLSDLEVYEDKAVELSGNGNEVILTGPGPVWLYLRLAHALHGKAKTLWYDSPVTGKVLVFNHDPH